MAIDVNLLLQHGAVVKTLKKNTIIFQEGALPKYYFQMVTGKVRMYNLTSDTKELTQGIFTDGESFAEPPLFINQPYPATAVAMVDSEVVYLRHEKFRQLLEKNATLQATFLKILAHKAYDKSMLARELVESSPENRINYFLNSFKRLRGGVKGQPLHITYTRQEIANSTGLRVETVIRTLSKMNKEKKVAIIDKKLFF